MHRKQELLFEEIMVNFMIDAAWTFFLLLSPLAIMFFIILLICLVLGNKKGVAIFYSFIVCFSIFFVIILVKLLNFYLMYSKLMERFIK